jgi:hypothetical protein
MPNRRREASPITELRQEADQHPRLPFGPFEGRFPIDRAAALPVLPDLRGIGRHHRRRLLAALRDDCDRALLSNHRDVSIPALERSPEPKAEGAEGARHSFRIRGRRRRGSPHRGRREGAGSAGCLPPTFTGSRAATDVRTVRILPILHNVPLCKTRVLERRREGRPGPLPR